jgi:hypothetical protein
MQVGPLLEDVSEMPSDQAPAILRHAFESMESLHGGLPSALEDSQDALVTKFPFLAHQVCLPLVTRHCPCSEQQVIVGFQQW